MASSNSLLERAKAPMAVLNSPVLLESASTPTAVLSLPAVRAWRANSPIAVLPPPVFVLRWMRAPAPSAVLELGYPPSGAGLRPSAMDEIPNNATAGISMNGRRARRQRRWKDEMFKANSRKNAEYIGSLLLLQAVIC